MRPGKVITLEVPEGVEHLTVQIGSHDDDLRDPVNGDVPLIVNHLKLTPGIHQVNSPYGGLIYLIPLKAKNISGNRQNQRSGRSPYVLGKTTLRSGRDSHGTGCRPFRGVSGRT